MKKMIRVLLTTVLACLLLPATALAAEEVAINETNFPDAVFRGYVADSFDKDASGTLNADEINSATTINVSSKGIADLKGVEYFTALRYLVCNENALTSLDVSRNTVLFSLNCCTNQLTSLDVSQNLALTYLSCYENKITGLDVSNNTALLELYCRDNALTSLDVNGSTALKKLYCQNNQLTELDVSSNAALTYINCRDNELSGLDVSKNIALLNLTCNHAGLSSLDVSNNTALTYLNCSTNEISSLDLSKNTALETLYCSNNVLTELDISNNTALTDLACKENEIGSLDISKNTALIHLECSYNKLTSLDVSMNAALTTLYFANNSLTSMDVSNIVALEKLFYGNNIYHIETTCNGTFDLSDLPAGFDISRTSNWVGGTVSDMILTVDADTSTVTYNYDCGNERIISFNLNVVTSGIHSYNTPEYQWAEDCSACNAVFICSKCEDTQKITCTVTETTLKRKLNYTASCEVQGQTYTDEKNMSKYKVTEVFSDVEDIWYVPYIQYAYDNELMDGTATTTFAPGDSLTRAMFVQILYAQEGKPEVETNAPFTDLTEKWYQNAVHWAYANDVVSGKSVTSFDPSGKITREQLAVMLYAYDGRPEVEESALDYPDVGNISDYAVKAITWAVQNGIISGKDVNGARYLEPQGNATRAEAATMLMQYLEK